jgi:hypothetical protein
MAAQQKGCARFLPGLGQQPLLCCATAPSAVAAGSSPSPTPGGPGEDSAVGGSGGLLGGGGGYMSRMSPLAHQLACEAAAPTTEAEAGEETERATAPGNGQCAPPNTKYPPLPLERRADSKRGSGAGRMPHAVCAMCYGFVFVLERLASTAYALCTAAQPRTAYAYAQP